LLLSSGDERDRNADRQEAGRRLNNPPRIRISRFDVGAPVERVVKLLGAQPVDRPRIGEARERPCLRLPSRINCGDNVEPFCPRRVKANSRHSRHIDARLIDVLAVADQPLLEKIRDHALSGEWKGYRDCHLKPDLLLIHGRPDAETLRLARLWIAQRIIRLSSMGFPRNSAMGVTARAHALRIVRHHEP
jgi:mRNA interferase YafQ